MNFILCFSIFFIFIFNLIVGKKLLFPGVIVSAVFFISSLLLFLNTTSWNYVIGEKTYIIIIFSLLLFTIGTTLGQVVAKKAYGFYCTGDFLYYIPKFHITFLSLVSILIVIMYFIHQYKLSLALGNSGGISEMFGTLRKMMKIKSEMYSLSNALNIGIAYVRALGYIGLYLFITHIIAGKQHTAKRYIIPIISLVLCEIISTSRIGFIIFTSAIVFNIYISYQKKGVAPNKRLLKYGILSFGIFFLAFYALGKLTGQSKVYSLWESLSIYAGSPLVCLDNFIKNSPINSEIFAQYSFKGLNSLLRRLGFAIPIYSNHLPNVYFGIYGSNVYTSLFPYIHDFGIILTPVIQFFLGTLFGIMWHRYNSKQEKSQMVMLYGRFFGYALGMYSIAERLCSEFLALNVFVELFWGFLIVRFIVLKPKEKVFYATNGSDIKNISFLEELNLKME